MISLLLIAQSALALSADVRYRGPLFTHPAQSKYVLGELGVLSAKTGGGTLWVYDSRHLEASEKPEDSFIESGYGLDPTSATILFANGSARLFPTSLLNLKGEDALFSAYADGDSYRGEGLSMHGRFIPLWKADQPGFGLAAVEGKDGFVYLYGIAHGKEGGMKLARARPESLDQPEAYEFFTGGGWSPDIAQAADLFTGSPAEASVSFNAYLGKYLMLYSRYPQNDVVIRTADEPWGAWSLPQTIHRCVLSDDKESCPAAREHPALAEDGGRRVFFTLNESFRFYSGGRPELYEARLDKTAEASAPNSFKISINYHYPASLFNIIDDLASPQSHYREFWRGQFGLDEKDIAMLEAYSRVKEAYALDVVRKGKPAPAALAPRHFNLAERWPLIFAPAETLEEAWRRASAWVDDGDIQTLREVFAHFDARFRPYWEKNSGYLYKASGDFERDRWAPRIADFLDQAARLYGLPQGLEREYTVSLLLHPGTDKVQHSRREGRLMLVEMMEGADIRDQVDVIAHEFSHDLYASMARADETLFKDGFDEGLFALQGMNEGLATALGQGFFKEKNLPERFDLKDSWYASDVDDYAKAVFPVVKKALAEGKPMTAVAAEWLSALKPLQGKAKLLDYFRGHLLLTDSATTELAPALFEALDVRDVAGFGAGDPDDLKRFADAVAAYWAEPVVLMLQPESLTDKVKSALDWESPPKAAPYAISRSKKGRPYLILVGSKKELEAEIAHLPERRL